MEVRHWRRQGRLPLLWWRDDDARHATPALERLLEIAGHHAVPITLAVIPADSLGGLAEILSRLPGAIIAQHGVTHSNARRPGEPPDEFPADVATDAVAVAMSAGADRLVSLPRRIALYVPPWNRVTPALGSALRLARLSLVSGHGGDHREQDGILRLDTHLDLLRWRGGARFRGESRFLWRFLRLLRKRRRDDAWQEPIGLPTHHLDHDGPSWAFLEEFLAFTTSACRCRWSCAAQLLGAEVDAGAALAKLEPATQELHEDSSL